MPEQVSIGWDSPRLGIVLVEKLLNVHIYHAKMITIVSRVSTHVSSLKGSIKHYYINACNFPPVSKLWLRWQVSKKNHCARITQ